MIKINKTDSKEVKQIKEKFNNCNCKSHMLMLKGRDLNIWADKYGVYNDGYKDLLCKWDEFDIIISKIKELGGKMYRCDSAAQSGLRIGDDKFPIDSMDAFIAMSFFNAKVGDKVTRRSTYYAAILAWAGIVTNVRGSNGQSGYVVLKN